MSIPRNYNEGIDYSAASYTLCGFCDASSTAYAAVVYLVAKTPETIRSEFVVAKTRVAPKQALTIPRLELLSTLLLSRLITTAFSALKSTLPRLDIRCYTDSMVALYWIKGINKEWKPFVQNRVNEIRQKTCPDQWYHCPGATNPADIPSRGLTMSELQVSLLWRHGPDWLKNSLALRDVGEHTEMPEECSDELKAKTHNLVTTEAKVTISHLVDCRRFSSFRKLVRVTAYVMRALKAFKGERSNQDSSLLSTDELVDAECKWIEDSQRDLEREGMFETLKCEFNAFLDQKGLWRCGGRLANADIPYSTKYPLLISRHHPMTPLVINDAHRRVLHNGVRDTLTEIRRFWIVKGRSLVRLIIHRCVTCRRFEGTPFFAPPPPPLPISRVKEEPAFSFTGVDFAGPLMIRTDGPNKSGKAWICLFTCFVTRAVHLDIVLNMSTETFIRCLKRFAA